MDGQPTEQRGEAFVDFALHFADGEGLMIKNGEARAVVAAILQSAQPVEKDGSGLMSAGVTDDSTHKFVRRWLLRLASLARVMV
jgi:hypothetical protein